MKSRLLIPELMDDPTLNAADHRQALGGLRRINRWTRNANLFWKPIKELAARSPGKPLRVLDIATGAADVPIAIVQRADREGVELDVSACDVSGRAIEFAAAARDRAGVPLRLATRDVLTAAIDDDYDVVMCSQFLHHLTDSQAEFVLQKMAEWARRRVVVVDLIRSRLNWLQVAFATRTLSRSQVVHFDGPQSIRAAFTLAEISTMAHQAGFARINIRRRWPCRFVLVGDVDGR